MKDSNLYIDIWNSAHPIIMEGLKRSFENKNWMEFKMSPDEFTTVGNRESYTFRLIYDNGFSARNGSAVGRDLQKVLNNIEFQDFAKGKYIIIRLTSKFKLEMLASTNEEQNN